MCSKKTTSSNHLTADLPSKKFIFQKEHQEVVIVSWHWSHAKESMNRVSHAHLSSAVITVALVQLLLLRSVFLTFLFLAHCHVIGVQLVRQSDCSKKHLRGKKKKGKQVWVGSRKEHTSRDLTQTFRVFSLLRYRRVKSGKKFRFTTRITK